tara:strand:+ start:213 stop:461 length:249 start_codon:yes stop_codon:yes gene_type:complete
MTLTMNDYLIGGVIGLLTIIVWNQARMVKQIDTLGEMLHVMLFHPDELEAWEGITSLEIIKVPNEEEHENDESWAEWDGNST